MTDMIIDNAISYNCLYEKLVTTEALHGFSCAKGQNLEKKLFVSSLSIAQQRAYASTPNGVSGLALLDHI
jgi:hypothetical protein